MIGDGVSRGPRYFCSNPAGAEALNLGRIPGRERLALVRQARQSRQAEERVDRLDDRVVVAFGMRHRMRARIRRDQDQRDADTARERQPVGPIERIRGGT